MKLNLYNLEIEINYSVKIGVGVIYRIQDAENLIIGETKFSYNYSNGNIKENKILLTELSQAEQLEKETLTDEMEFMPIISNYYEGI